MSMSILGRERTRAAALHRLRDARNEDPYLLHAHALALNEHYYVCGRHRRSSTGGAESRKEIVERSISTSILIVAA